MPSQDITLLLYPMVSSRGDLLSASFKHVLMYIQISILVKATFFLETIQQSGLIINQRNKRNMVFRTTILSKTDILTKLTKNLVTVASSFWTRNLVKNFYMRTFTMTWTPFPPLCIYPHFDGPSTPLSANVIIECSQGINSRSQRTKLVDKSRLN